MKNIKKVIFSMAIIFTLAFTTFFICRVKAKPLPVKVPDIMPGEDDMVSAVLDDSHSYDVWIKTKFSNGSIANNWIPSIRIVLTTTPNSNGGGVLGKLGNNWFNAYCLDANLNYPVYGLANREKRPQSKSAPPFNLLGAVEFTLINNKDLKDVFTKVKEKGYQYMDDITLELNGKDELEIIDEIENGNEVEVLVKEIRYCADEEINDLIITAADLSGNESDTTYPVKIKKSDIMFDKYYAKNLDNKNYNHALWIVEHSYPTLPIQDALIIAGVDIYKLEDELALLNVNKNGFEKYIYSTVQLAIWKVNGGVDFDGNEIGDEIVDSNELNKLFQYLIKDREEYNNYDKLVYDTTINIKNPSGNEIFKNTKEYYVYGPYTVDSNSILGTAKISIDGDKSGISIIDEKENKIDAIINREEYIELFNSFASNMNINNKFYIKVMKKNKVANVKLKLEDASIITFPSNNDRARVFTSVNPLVQNTISGGKITYSDINKTVDIVFNPKTGVENIGTIISIILVVFLLGYLLLSIKSKAVEL